MLIIVYSSRSFSENRWHLPSHVQLSTVYFVEVLNYPNSAKTYSPQNELVTLEAIWLANRLMAPFSNLNWLRRKSSKLDVFKISGKIPEHSINTKVRFPKLKSETKMESILRDLSSYGITEWAEETWKSNLRNCYMCVGFLNLFILILCSYKDNRLWNS